MPIVTFVSTQGQRTPCVASEGSSAMMAALVNAIDGVLAECGGSLSCGTCHVYVEPSQLALLPQPNAAEDALLELTASERRPNSRLSCQIRLTAALDGLLLHLPPAQT